MLNDELLKAVIEGIIYIAPEPVSAETVAKALEGETVERVRQTIEALIAEYDQPGHGIQIRPVAGGYKFSSKAEHHEVFRSFVKGLKPPVKLSKPALETLAVIAYRQPVTVPEIEQIRGVNCGGVIHTLLEKKLVVTAGRKNVVGRPILYRTSREFLVHFGLKELSELPSLREFEEMARESFGAGLTGEDTGSEASAQEQENQGGEAALQAQTADNTAAAADIGEEAGVPVEAEAERAVGSTGDAPGVDASGPAAESPAQAEDEDDAAKAAEAGAEP